MIRSQELLDKLVADLHFHHYLFVYEGDHLFSDRSSYLEQIEDTLKILVPNSQLNVHTDFFHGGKVVTDSQIDYIYQFIDDVYIDYFFRTYSFFPIVFPKGLCYEQITEENIIHPDTEIKLNLNNLYDRCTFVNNIGRLLGCDETLLKWFPNNNFIKKFFLNKKNYGLNGYCRVLKSQLPFSKDFDDYLSVFHPGRAVINPQSRGKELLQYLNFLSNKSSYSIDEVSLPSDLAVTEFYLSFLKIKDSHIFGEYTIEEILIIYAILIDKLELNEDSFLLSLCFCIQRKSKIDNRILTAFIDFEKSNQNYRLIEPYICSEDLYLRFASRSKSKAFKYVPINDTTVQITLFNKDSINLPYSGNSMPLPYLYHKLNKNNQ